MSKKQILKIIGIILLVIIAIVLIHTTRNYIIIKDLQTKIANYSNSENYHIKATTVSDSGTTSEMNYYKKNKNQVVFMERNVEHLKMSIYDNGETINTYLDTLDSKTALLDCSEFEPINLYNNLETDNKLQTFLGSITSKIKSVNYNGKECYDIKGFISKNASYYTFGYCKNNILIIIYFLNHTIIMANNLTFGIFYAIMELKSIFT